MKVLDQVVEPDNEHASATEVHLCLNWDVFSNIFRTSSQSWPERKCDNPTVSTPDEHEHACTRLYGVHQRQGFFTHNTPPTRIAKIRGGGRVAIVITSSQDEQLSIPLTQYHKNCSLFFVSKVHVAKQKREEILQL